MDWPADRAERRPIASLLPQARNARQHSAEQIAQLAKAIEQWGWTTPCLIDERSEIIAGHGRILAAQSLGLTEAPCVIARGWSEEQKRAYIIADNRLAEIATWDYDILQAELAALGERGFPLDLIGFGQTTAELEQALSELEPQPEQGRAIPTKEEAALTLAERFGAVPFSTFNAREGWWQARKAAWIGLGIQSELGRGENLLKFSDTVRLDIASKRA